MVTASGWSRKQGTEVSGDSQRSHSCATAFVWSGLPWTSGSPRGPGPRGLGRLEPPGQRRPSRGRSRVHGYPPGFAGHGLKALAADTGTGGRRGPQTLPREPPGQLADMAHSPAHCGLACTRPRDRARSDVSISSVCTCVSWLPPPLAFHSEMTLGTAHFSLPHSLGLSFSAFQFPFSPRSPPVWSPRCPHGPSSGSLSLVTCVYVCDSGPAPSRCFAPCPWSVPWRARRPWAWAASWRGLAPPGDPLYSQAGPASPGGVWLCWGVCRCLSAVCAEVCLSCVFEDAWMETGHGWVLSGAGWGSRSGRTLD